MKEVYGCSYCGRISTIRQSFDIRKRVGEKVHLFCDEECDTSYLVASLKEEALNNSLPNLSETKIYGQNSVNEVKDWTKF